MKNQKILTENQTKALLDVFAAAGLSEEKAIEVLNRFIELSGAAVFQKILSAMPTGDRESVVREIGSAISDAKKEAIVKDFLTTRVDEGELKKITGVEFGVLLENYLSSAFQNADGERKAAMVEKIAHAQGVFKKEEKR